jgi:hypothetical protein
MLRFSKPWKEIKILVVQTKYIFSLVESFLFFCEKGIILSTNHSTTLEFYYKHPGSTRYYKIKSLKLVFLAS